MDPCEGVGCRKRARSDPDDCEECMPISKRINNLHIRPSTESWEELEHHIGENFNNKSVVSCPNPGHMPSAYTPGMVQIPGLAMGPMLHFHHGYTPPDINHNNPLLSPMPRQPCPSSILASQACSGCNQYPRAPSIHDKNNSYYFQINSTLYQAHMERLSRIQGHDQNT